MRLASYRFYGRNVLLIGLQTILKRRSASSMSAIPQTAAHKQTCKDVPVVRIAAVRASYLDLLAVN